MPRNSYLYENIMFTNKVNAASFGVGKEKEVALIERVKLTEKFEETLEVNFLSKVGPSLPEKLELIMCV